MCVIMFEMCQFSALSLSCALNQSDDSQAVRTAIRQSRSPLIDWAAAHQRPLSSEPLAPDLHPVLAVCLSSILPPRAALQASTSANIQAPRLMKTLQMFNGLLNYTGCVQNGVLAYCTVYTAYIFLNSMWKCMQCAMLNVLNGATLSVHCIVGCIFPLCACCVLYIWVNASFFAYEK